MLTVRVEKRQLPNGILRVILPKPPIVPDVLSFLWRLRTAHLEADLTGDQLTVRCELPLSLEPPENLIVHALRCTGTEMAVSGTLYCPDGHLVHTRISAGAPARSPSGRDKDFICSAAKN